MKILRILLSVLLLSLLAAPVAAARLDYDVDYTVQFLPEAGEAAVTIRITPGEGTASRLRLHMPEARYTQVRGDGGISRQGDTVTWLPQRDKASRLRFRYRIDNERRGGGFDARITDDWVIVRGDDLVPRAVVRATKGADSRARLRFILPKGWNAVDTPFLRSADKKSFVITNPERNFDRPVGWIVAGVVGLHVGALAAVAAFQVPETREAAAVTFLVTASGISILGISGAFWGLIAGVAMLGLVKLAKARA